MEQNALAVAVILVVVVIAAVAGLSIGSLTSPTSASLSTSRQASSHPPSAGLNVTNMFVVVLSGRFEPPSSNSTTINGGHTTFAASAGTTFTVDVDIEYSDCGGNGCPAEITSVSVAPASFTVQAITVMPPNSGAGLPALVSPTSGNGRDCRFSVTITAPSTAYAGPLTLTAQTA
jgi:hypothetical protein